MSYDLTFFCRAGHRTGREALAQLLDELLATGAPVLCEWRGPFVEQVAACSLATADGGGRPAADRLTVEVHVGVDWIADSVIEASPEGEHGIWGCDLLATVTLGGDVPDWPLVDRIWETVTDLWAAVPWDEASGFDVSGSRTTG